MTKPFKPLVIPVFIPHSGCPHQCSFCNQKIITSQKESLPDSDQIKNAIESYLSYKGKRKKVELAFFGGNFLGLYPDRIKKILECAQDYILVNKIDSIRFSTRPDTISEQALDLIKDYSVETIEIGVQSMNDKVLELSQRGHTSNDTINAVNILRKYDKKIGIQIMIGLPGDDYSKTIATAEKIIDLKPDFVRIYPLIVLNKSLLAKWYNEKKYTPLSLDESVVLVKEIYKLFNQKHIPVIRMGLQSSDIFDQKDVVIAGPWHPAFGHLVLSEIFYDKACNLMDSVQKTKENKKVLLKINPASESRLRGDKNQNIKRLNARYPQLNILIFKDESLDTDDIQIEYI